MNILIVCHWFPPANVIGAVRPYRMARYFNQRGHSVHVLCGSESISAGDLKVDLENICTHQIRLSRILQFMEPSTESTGFLRYVKFLLRQCFFPDQYIGLKRIYLNKFKEIFQAGFEPDVVISSALPFSMHLIGQEIAFLSKCKWVADNRDLWASSPYRRRPNLLRKMDVKYEARILNSANLILAIGSRMADSLKSVIVDSSKVLVVRNGADINFIDDVRQNNTSREVGLLKFVYTGILYGGMRDPSPLFEALVETDINATVNFYGSESSCIENYKLNYKNISIMNCGRLPKMEIKAVQKEADFLVVALGEGEFEKSVLTGKFYEYVEARRPIIAICDEDSELASMINLYKVGIATRNIRQIGDFISEVVSRGLIDLPAPSVELTGDFQMGILESCLLN